MASPSPFLREILQLWNGSKPVPWQCDDSGAAAVSPVTVGPELAADAAGTSQNGTYAAVGTTSAQTAAISASLVDVTFVPSDLTTAAKQFCYISVGTAPVAAAPGDYVLVGFKTIRIPITPGNKIAAIAGVASAGLLYAHPVE
jgi:hypothetical protein